MLAIARTRCGSGQQHGYNVIILKYQREALGALDGKTGDRKQDRVRAAALNIRKRIRLYAYLLREYYTIMPMSFENFVSWIYSSPGSVELFTEGAVFQKEAASSPLPFPR